MAETTIPLPVETLRVLRETVRQAAHAAPHDVRLQRALAEIHGWLTEVPPDPRLRLTLTGWRCVVCAQLFPTRVVARQHTDPPHHG